MSDYEIVEKILQIDEKREMQEDETEENIDVENNTKSSHDVALHALETAINYISSFLFLSQSNMATAAQRLNIQEKKREMLFKRLQDVYDSYKKAFKDNNKLSEFIKKCRPMEAVK
ncbi:hypothetical protein HHI36_014552 [Cryptolaemus montrouzieri]|uniref:Uncharacterized protein n=1 Tax=Cryptolaemus montrouzieri TaxID=559131 RepID=A0ABD2N3D2_9CUCU